MEEYNFTGWTEAQAKGLRCYRRIANSFWLLATFVLVMNLGHWTLPQSAWPLAILSSIYLISWFGVVGAFFYGIIKCPSCDKRFFPKFLPPVWVPRRCQNCQFDIFTLRHGTSN